jgi:tryptophan synthase alpha subunit
MQAGGADVLELGVPFTDPQADGATIQKANETALLHGVTLHSCIEMVIDIALLWYHFLIAVLLGCTCQIEGINCATRSHGLL